MNEIEIKGAIDKGLAALDRVAGALESIAKIARWGWRQEKKRQKGLDDAAAPLAQAKIAVGREPEVCIYCQTKSRYVMRGDLIVGCVHCITEAFAESLRNEEEARRVRLESTAAAPRENGE